MKPLKIHHYTMMIERTTKEDVMTKIEAATKKYEAAYAKRKAANAAMRLAETQYRARQIGDEQFLAARKAWILAKTEFDIAYAEAEESGVKEANLV